MWDILKENAGTILVLGILFAIIVTVVALMIKGKKRGKSCCSSGCCGCPFSGKCGDNNQT